MSELLQKLNEDIHAIINQDLRRIKRIVIGKQVLEEMFLKHIFPAHLVEGLGGDAEVDSPYKLFEAMYGMIVKGGVYLGYKVRHDPKMSAYKIILKKERWE